MLDRLVRALDAALRGDVAPDPPPPWLGWLVVVLMRQRARQAWHREVVDTRLRGEDPDRGDVPGLPGWTYFFHGMGCCLTGPDGETVDVDRHDDTAAIIDPWFFSTRVDSIRSRDLPEGRLWHWMPGEGLIVAALDELRDGGALEYPDGNHVFRLAAPLEQRVAALEACDFGDRAVGARWSAALGDREDAATLAAYRSWLLARATDDRHASSALEGAAARLSQEDLRDVTLRLLQGPIRPATGRAIKVLRARPDPRCDGAVRALLERLSPTEDPPYPAYEALAYLFERGVDPHGVTQHFLELAAVERAKGFTGNPFLGKYAVLALRHRPALALALARRALRSSTPACVMDIAALLCVIDQPWCHRELVAALPEATRWGKSYVAEALRRSGSALAGRRDDAGSFLSLEPVRALGAELRDRYPPAWEG